MYFVLPPTVVYTALYSTDQRPVAEITRSTLKHLFKLHEKFNTTNIENSIEYIRDQYAPVISHPQIFREMKILMHEKLFGLVSDDELFDKDLESKVLDRMLDTSVPTPFLDRSAEAFDSIGYSEVFKQIDRYSMGIILLRILGMYGTVSPDDRLAQLSTYRLAYKMSGFSGMIRHPYSELADLFDSILENGR